VGRRCPICGKLAVPRAGNRAFPFCSDRCRLVDLGRWLGEEYRIAGQRAGDGDAPAAREGDEEDP
jgi:endogenous inhibitor of DNA gyrase (YacG/DUF329 family)